MTDRQQRRWNSEDAPLAYINRAAAWMQAGERERGGEISRRLRFNARVIYLLRPLVSPLTVLLQCSAAFLLSKLEVQGSSALFMELTKTGVADNFVRCSPTRRTPVALGPIQIRIARSRNDKLPRVMQACRLNQIDGKITGPVRQLDSLSFLTVEE